MVQIEREGEVTEGNQGHLITCILMKAATAISAAEAIHRPHTTFYKELNASLSLQ